MRQFFLYVRPEANELPIEQRVNLIVWYAMVAASLIAIPFNTWVDLNQGEWRPVWFQMIYLGFILSSVVVFFRSRSIKHARLMSSIGILILVAYLIAEGGGTRGLGLFYFITSFSLLYFVLGFRGGLAFAAFFIVGVGLRFLLGNLPPQSIFADPSLRLGFFVVFAIATGLGVVALLYQHRLIAYLGRLAYLDEVTGLFNRTRMAEHLTLSVSGNQPFFLVAIKLFQFGQISSYHGMEIGDRLLSETAGRIQRASRPGDMVGRWSGTLFLVKLNITDSLAAKEWCTQLLGQLDQAIETEHGNLTLRLGMAITRFPEDGLSTDRLLANLNNTLAANQEASGKLRFFNEAAWKAEQRKLYLADAIKGAIERHELSLAYHPKIHFADGSCRGAEVLVRWNHPELGSVSPAEFIPIAEATGFIREITRFVVEQHLADMATISAHPTLQGLSISHAINLSPLDLGNLDLPGWLRSRCQAQGVPTRLIELEITEGSMISDNPQVQMVLAALKDLGFRVAIDDFGTGYSSLNYLHRLHADNLKIDQSFVRRLGSDESMSPIIDAIISMGKSLGMTITAEGVETRAQADYLLARGCNYAQGWLYSKPMPLADYLAWLDRCKDGHCS